MRVLARVLARGLAGVLTGVLLVVIAACDPGATRAIVEPPPGPSATDSNPDWTLASHGAAAAPDYSVVFPQDAVNTLELVMTAAQWAAVQVEVSALFGVPFGGGGAPTTTFPDQDPAYLPVAMRFNGKRWDHVGFRLKGNSSLATAWRAGNLKLPFRINLDRFEGQFPAILDQRLHGFHELSFSPGTADPSLIREKLASDVLRSAGIAAARTAFFKVFLDIGAGARYVGVYTAVEVIDDTMVRDQFGEDAGNIYKPMSRLSAFVQSEFEKKNNRTAADWTDVQAFLTALQSPLRTTDTVAWRAGLEATFDVGHFLRWLALNTAMVNWDSYGTMPQNYYLYHHPTRGLVWIPWDHNEALRGNPPVTATVAGTQGLSLALGEVGAQWPLIRKLMDDRVYAARYRTELADLRATVFTETTLFPLIDRYHALVSPWAVGPQGEQVGATYLPSASAFFSARTALRAHVQVRRGVIATFVP